MDNQIIGLLSKTIICFFFFHTVISTPLTKFSERGFIRNETSATNKTITDLVQQQTDTVKKIVSNQQQAHLNYPLVTKLPPENKQNNQEIEDLKIRCQYLAKLVNKTNSPPPTTSTTESNKSSLRPLGGFYVTTEATTSKKPSTLKPIQNIKYIKLEPVILQKTILNDGRTIYYWHKSIPSAVQIASAVTSTTTPPPPPLTTTPGGYNFRNFFPSFYSIGSSESSGATTTEKTPTTEEFLYQQQLKFVVPVPYANPEDPGIRKPGEIDQFAYYPKPLQPETINLQVPYVPTFHIIKAIAIPNEQNNESNVDGQIIR